MVAGKGGAGAMKLYRRNNTLRFAGDNYSIVFKWLSKDDLRHYNDGGAHYIDIRSQCSVRVW